MARVVVKEAQGPMELKGADGKSHWVCMCGLSGNEPFCDGSHKKTAGEEKGKVYKYSKDGTRVEVKP